MSDQLQKGVEHVVFCDMCFEGDRKPAHKTCMKCEISMCVQHLQAHLTTPVLLQTHPLTEPMALCGTSKCPQHGKLLEYYCLDDMTCVCVSCAIEDQHRLHNMKTFPTAHKELMEKINAEQQDLQEKTCDDNMSLEKWEKGEREKLSQCGVRLVEAATRLRDLALTSIQSSVSARMVSIKTSRSSMQAAQEEKDTFRFLQMYSQVHQDVARAKDVDLRRGLEPGSDRDKVVEEIRESGEKMVMQADQFWCSLLTLVDPENHSELGDTDSDLVFQPEVLGGSLSLSPDKRKVFYHEWMGQCNATVLIQSDKSAGDFRRWLVHLSADCDWTMGLCDQQSVTNVRGQPMYGMVCTGEQVSATHWSSKTELVVPRPETLEVCWNIGASSLSFYNRPGWHKREDIITFKMSPIPSSLVPFIQLQKENKSQKRSQCPQLSQDHWNCSCGLSYKKTNKGYSRSGVIYPNSSSHTCSCGVVIGSLVFTELLCELL